MEMIGCPSHCPPSRIWWNRAVETTYRDGERARGFSLCAGSSGGRRALLTQKIMVIISHTMLEAIPAKKLNEPLRTKMTAAKAKRVVHAAVKRTNIILFSLLAVSLVVGPTSYVHASNAAGITPVARSEPPLAVILVEEVAEKAYIGGSDEA